MSQETSNLVHAGCAIAASANGGAVVPTFTNNRGFSQVFASGSTHTALGIYNLALDEPVAAAECWCVAVPRAAAAADATATVTQTSAGVKTVNTFLAGAASDAVAFDLIVYRIPAS